MALPGLWTDVISNLRRRMEQELATLTRGVASREAPTPLVADELDRAVANEAHELLTRGHERARAKVRALREALRKIDAGTYGGCELCGAPIAMRRLDAIPETPFCRECAERLDCEAVRTKRGDPPTWADEE